MVKVKGQRYLTVSFTCPGCNGSRQVLVPERAIDEPLVLWLDRVHQLATATHEVLAPGCEERCFTIDVPIPLDAVDVGRKV